MRRGEIWHIDLHPSSGHEMDGPHYVLILTRDEFNHAFRMPGVVPISTGGRFDRERGFAVSLTGAGTRTTGVVCCSQYRTLDLRSRNGRFVEKAPDYIVDESLERVLSSLE
ncbi:MAG: type II toxin-antitoxin system PemK/MazF family toxin [Janthinobacterium lividum]